MTLINTFKSVQEASRKLTLLDEEKVNLILNALAGRTEKNIDFIQYFLAKEKIPVVASDVGGNGGRKVYFFPETGKVLVAKIKAGASLVSIEEKYQEEITNKKPADDVFLF